jgi:hypothetical protein
MQGCHASQNSGVVGADKLKDVSVSDMEEGLHPPTMIRVCPARVFLRYPRIQLPVEPAGCSGELIEILTETTIQNLGQDKCVTVL